MENRGLLLRSRQILRFILRVREEEVIEMLQGVLGLWHKALNLCRLLLFFSGEGVLLVFVDQLVVNVVEDGFFLRHDRSISNFIFEF